MTNRFAVFGVGLAASVLPALLLTAGWASPGRTVPTFLAFWTDILAGPVKYWLPVLLGHPTPPGLHPMPGVSTWLYAVCYPLAFAHPLWPRPWTARVTATAFGVWYASAFVVLNSFEY